MNKPFKCSLRSVRTPLKWFRVSSVPYLSEVSDFVLLFQMWWRAFAAIFPFFFSFFLNPKLVDICEPREGKIVVIMKMSTSTCQISTPHPSLSRTERFEQAEQLKGNGNWRVLTGNKYSGKTSPALGFWLPQCVQDSTQNFMWFMRTVCD